MVEMLERTGRKPVLLTLPGHGPSPSFSGPADFADLAGLVGNDLPPTSFDAIGYSLGAKLLLELAIRMPGRIGRLVLGGVGDNVFAPEAVAEAAAHALEHGVDAATPPPVLAFFRTWDPTRNRAAAIAAVLRRPANPVFTQERLRAISAPILLINGSADPAAGTSERLRNCLSNVRLQTLSGVNHFDLPAHPDFVRAAANFLSSEQGWASPEGGR
jgi:pimeloyl-ACP methyl ester carboxylesterase